MEKLIKKIKRVQGTGVSDIIRERLKEFSSVDDLFSELCFCLMTAGFRADKCIEIQKEVGVGFHDLSLEELKIKLKEMGHRFWPQRAERIVLARNSIKELERVSRNGDRDWLVKNVKGLGMKESSHFLRNVGFNDVAIVDFHIIDLLDREGLIDFDRKNSLTKIKYLSIEKLLRKLGKKTGLSLAELDLYLWYLETGKVLK